jgi:hypothetical protein
LKRFAEAYIHHLNLIESSQQPVELDMLLSEVLLFEPLTWLEASIFFLFAMTEDEAHAEKWTALAKHRWENYEKSRHKVDTFAQQLAK